LNTICRCSQLKFSLFIAAALVVASAVIASVLLEWLFVLTPSAVVLAKVSALSLLRPYY
jgi:hypothetical protein